MYSGILERVIIHLEKDRPKIIMPQNLRQHRCYLPLSDFHLTCGSPQLGGGHMAEVLKREGYKVKTSDLYDRGYPGTEIIDFLSCDAKDLDLDIVTNPPYSLATEFIEKALDVVGEGHKVAMLLKIQFLEGIERRIRIYDRFNPKVIYASTKRLNCAKNGEFGTFQQNSAIAYAWFIWVKGYKGETVVKWVN